MGEVRGFMKYPRKTSGKEPVHLFFKTAGFFAMASNSSINLRKSSRDWRRPGESSSTSEGGR